MAEHLLFIYGTARRSNKAHFLMTDPSRGHAELIGIGWTVQKYPLIVGSRFKMPLLLFRPGTGKNVFGDVYRIDDKLLQHLDIVEQVPLLYDRDWIRIHLTKDANGEDIADQNITHNCHVYFMKNFKPELLDEEYISDYDSSAAKHDVSWSDVPDDWLEIVRREVTLSNTDAESASVKNPLWVQIKPDEYKHK